MYVSFGKQKMDEHDTIVQNFDGKNYYIGGYLNQKLEGDWNVGSILGYGYGNHQSNRMVMFSSVNKNLEADFNSHSIYGGVKISKQTYQNSWVTLTPEAGLDYTYYQQDKINESGDNDLSLIIDKADAQSIIASIGLNAQFDSLSEQNNIYPLAFMRYEHDFYANKNNEHEIDASLSAHPDYKQTFVGQNRGENALITGIGIGSNINSALQINGGLVFSKHTHGKEWGAGLSLEYTW